MKIERNATVVERTVPIYAAHCEHCKYQGVWRLNLDEAEADGKRHDCEKDGSNVSRAD